ncbi:ABC transporter substrate-binding protein [Aureimonas fodinaquatilis]|uniref:ABC transporter substrate-binding protein n=1 Tax=Aureimonas fodinaquatilis TaxID=2565783 RepID=UPI00165DA368|nr:ABC transporter substrate-binding protein [Aureimonas fodinaquatilis]
MRKSLTAVLATAFLTLGAASADPVALTDQRGRQFELAEPASRIVVIPLPMASVVMALDGSSDRLVAIHPSARKSVEEGFLGKVFPGALELSTDVTRGGQFTPNLESILALEPDAVIQWREPDNLLEPLDSAGLNAIGLINSPPNEEINQQNLAIVAKLIGRQDRLEQVLAWHDAALASVQGVTDGMEPGLRPKAMYLHAAEERFRPAGANVYQDFWLTLAGGTNVAAAELRGMSAEVNAEQILAWNPDVIILGAFDAATPADIAANPLLAETSAVKNKRVYKMPHGGYRWDPGSHESHLTMQWAAMVMHPEEFDFDLRQAMRDSYRFFYNHALTEDEIDQILALNENAGMAGYDRFTR